MIFSCCINNNSLSIGLHCSEKNEFTEISIKKDMTVDDFGMLITQLLNLYNISEKFEGAVIASVVPSLTQVLKDAIIKFYIEDNIIIVGPGIKTGLNIKINDPSELGGDIVSMAIAAINKYELPCVMININDITVTVSYIDQNGAFCGTVISSGILTSLNALKSVTDLLPSVELSIPTNVIGTDSRSAVRSGLIFGTAAMIDGLIYRINEQRGEIKTIIATGNNAQRIVPFCTQKILYDYSLLNDGMMCIYQKQTKK